MSVTAWIDPSNGYGGSLDPGNIISANGLYGVALLGGDGLYGDGYGLGSIGTSDTINGIEIRLNGFVSGELVSNGDLGLIRFHISKNNGSTWSTTSLDTNVGIDQAEYTIGNGSQLWGYGSLVGSDIIGTLSARASFVSITSGNADELYVDVISVRITYTTAGGGSSVVVVNNPLMFAGD